LSSHERIGPELGLLNEGVVKSVRELSKAEHDQYKRGNSLLLQFWNDQQLFQIARLNHLEFENLVDSHLREYAAHAVVDWHHMNMMVREANRRILNYLCSVRTFLDHSEFNLKDRHGKESERVRQFKEACSHSYDSVFSYRFIYQLRNYVQHCGMPVGSFSLSSAVDRTTEQVTHTLGLYFDRDTLLKYDSWGTQLETEIRNLPNEIDVIPHLRAMMECIGSINQIVIRDELQGVGRASQVMKDLLDEASRSGKGTPCILFLSKSAVEPSGVEMTVEWIPLHTINIGGFLVSSP
jgi:hypothetical protein